MKFRPPCCAGVTGLPLRGDHSLVGGLRKRKHMPEPTRSAPGGCGAEPVVGDRQNVGSKGDEKCLAALVEVGKHPQVV